MNNVANNHRLRILRDTVRNPMKALLGGPTEQEALIVLKESFGYTDKQIEALRED